MSHAAVTVTTAPAVDASALAPPDWSAIEVHVVCPLCAYNLRRLAEPRCAECGYAFTWPDLLDPARRPHPYLFEHNPRHNVRSFVRTYFAGLLPRRFWRTLQPIQPIRPPRLAAHYVIATALFIVAPLVLVGWPWVQSVRNELDNRATWRAWVMKNPAVAKEMIDRYGSIDAYLDTWPSPYWGSWMIVNLRSHMTHDTSSINAAAVALLWPWMTFATLMIFRASMRRAKVRRGHVLRCTLYGCDWTACSAGSRCGSSPRRSPNGGCRSSIHPPRSRSSLRRCSRRTRATGWAARTPCT
jgi:hypothetical protein